MYVPTALGVERRGDRDTGNEFLSHARNNIGIVDALMGFALAHLRHQQSPLDVAKPVPKGARMDDATPLFFPQLGPVYQALFPWVEMLLRAVVGLTLVPHGLRSTFGMFSSTGALSHNLTEFADELDHDGYHPGKLWAPAIVLTQLVAGPMLALGLFTRLAACPIVIFLIVTNYERWRVGGFFWNKMGLEFTLMWTVGALYFLVHGGGEISVDHLVIVREF